MKKIILEQGREVTNHISKEQSTAKRLVQLFVPQEIWSFQVEKLVWVLEPLLFKTCKLAIMKSFNNMDRDKNVILKMFGAKGFSPYLH